MYHHIIKQKIIKSFELGDRHEYQELFKSVSPTVKHRSSGNHALGGERNNVALMKKWFERLGKVLPNLKLTIEAIWIKGWPNNTIVIVKWTSNAILANQEPYQNRGVHIINLKWGKACAFDIYEDTQAAAIALSKQAASGIPEAAAAKIES